MSANWYVLSLFGSDQLGIVAKTTQCLYQLDANLSETNMSRLGDYFTIIMFLQYDGDINKLTKHFETFTKEMNLKFHFDKIDQHQHIQLVPNIRISCYSSDRTGLIAQVSQELVNQQVNILNVQSDVSGSGDEMVFIMIIEGIIENIDDKLTQATANLKQVGIDINIEPIDTLVG